MTYADQVVTVSKFFFVFPVFLSSVKGVPQKVPAVRGWQDVATQDEDEIRALWKRYPNAGVGALTGEKAGFVLLDLDKKNGLNGIAVMKEHMKTNGKLPKTLGATSVSGGKHRFYKVNKKKDYSTFGVHTDILPLNGEKRTGIDTRSTGGFVLIWPTKGYEFHGELGEMAKVPSWITDKIELAYERRNEENGSAPPIEVDEVEMKSDLAKLDPVNFQTREDWMNVMMMCHSGCAAADWGRELFTEWSLRDDSGFSCEPVEYAERMWRSLNPGKLEGLTYASLKREVKKAILASGFESFDDEEFEKPELEIRKDPDVEIVIDEDGNTSRTISGRKADSAWSMIERMQSGKGTGEFSLAKNMTNMVSFLEQEKLPALLGRVKNPLAGLVAYNELKESAVYTRNPPWALVGSRKNAYKDVQVPEEDVHELQIFISQYWHLEIPTKTIENAIETAAVRNKFNPVVEYLESLKWDGKKRLKTWLWDVGKVKRNAYTMAVAEKSLLAMSARALHPGCKVDTALVFEGDQNIGKSGILKILGKDWYGAPTIVVGTVDAEQNLQGLWVVEWEEYAGGRKTDADKNKKYLTNNVAYFRGSYGRKAKAWPRRCTINITLNPQGDNTWLNDPTGGRRYWPIEFGVKDPEQVNFKWLEKNVDQLHAEAYATIKNTPYKDIQTCKPWTMDAEETKEARLVQNDRIVKDTLEEDVRLLLYGDEVEWSEKLFVTAREVAMEISGDVEFRRDGARLQSRITTILKNVLKWETKQTRIPGVKGPRRAYHRPLKHEDQNA